MLHAIALNCTLKRSGQPSSTSLLLSQVGQAMKAHQIGFEEVRIADQKRSPPMAESPPLPSSATRTERITLPRKCSRPSTTSASRSRQTPSKQ